MINEVLNGVAGIVNTSRNMGGMGSISFSTSQMDNIFCSQDYLSLLRNDSIAPSPVADNIIYQHKIKEQ